MKKLIYFCGFSLIASAALSSCLFEEDNIFDESPALRGQHYSEKITDVLFTPEYGWIMQYYANANSKGYNIYARFFENGTVILTSDHEYVRNNPGHRLVSDTSTYVLNEQDGPVLSFNSWNDILSVFTDPVDPSSPAVEDGVGLEGDNEFVVMQVNENDILMRGERHEGKVRLLKCDRPVEEMVAAVKATETDILAGVNTEYFLISNHEGFTDTIFMYGTGDGVLDFTNLRGEDRVDRSIAYICTPTGIRFQSDFAFDYYVAQGTDTTFWTYNNQTFEYTDDKNAMVSEDGQITLVPNWIEHIGSRISSPKRKAHFELKEGDETWQQLCADLNQAIKKADSKQLLQQIAFGNSGETGVMYRYGLCFDTKKYVTGMGGQIIQDGDVYTFIINKEDVSNYLSAFVQKGLGPKFEAIADYLNGSWKMTTDDRTFAPHYIRLTNLEDESKYIYQTLD